MNKTLNSKNLVIGVEQLKEEFFIKKNIYTSKCLEFLKEKDLIFFMKLKLKNGGLNIPIFQNF